MKTVTPAAADRGDDSGSDSDNSDDDDYNGQDQTRVKLAESAQRVSRTHGPTDTFSSLLAGYGYESGQEFYRFHEFCVLRL